MAVEPLQTGDPPAIGAYELLGRLGSGGMGQVFLGQARSGQRVAVKVVHEELAGEAQFRQRFRAEVRAAQRVSGVWTAPVLDCDTESDTPWVATAYVAGAPLQQVVDTLHGPLAEHSVWALALGLVQALTRIHEVGLIHRDLKPSNVMVSRQGPKVIDFGIARAVDASTVLTRTGEVLGTPGYMAPEQIRGEHLTGAVDVFALGAVLAFAATGLQPFSWDGAGVHSVLYRVMDKPPYLGPDDGPLRGGLRELVSRCLEKRPAERPDLAEILPLAKAGAGTKYWLPSSLRSRLGPEATRLPPEEPRPAATAPPHGEAAPTVRHSDPTLVRQEPAAWGTSWAGPAPGTPAQPPRPPDPTTPRGPRTLRMTLAEWLGPRRNRYLLGAISAVVASALVAGGLLLADNGETDPPQDAGGQSPGATRAPLAQLVPQDVRDAGGLTVHVADTSSELLVVEGGGTPTGFEVDLVKAMGKELGVDIKFTKHANDDDTAPAAVAQGRTTAADLAMAGLSDTADNRKTWGVDMVDYLYSGLGVIGDGEHEDLSEVCGKKIITYSDDALLNLIREEADCRKPLSFLPSDSHDEMVDAVLEGKADLAVLQYPLAAEALRDRPKAELTLSLAIDGKGPRGIAVPSGQPELQKAVVEALKALVEDGTYQRLIRRWNLMAGAVNRVEINSGH